MDDVERLLVYIDEHGIDAESCAPRGWDHIGAIIADAVLQRRNRYQRVVRPRVENMILEWPDASTTSGLQRRIAAGELASAIKWSGEDRLHQVAEIADVFTALGIETPEELSASLSTDPRRKEVRKALRKIKYVGPKTLDYFDILVGCPGLAIDERIRSVAADAGIADLSYEHLHAVIKNAADIRNWDLRNLDYALWQWGGTLHRDCSIAHPKTCQGAGSLGHNVRQTDGE